MDGPDWSTLSRRLESPTCNAHVVGLVHGGIDKLECRAGGEQSGKRTLSVALASVYRLVSDGYPDQRYDQYPRC